MKRIISIFITLILTVMCAGGCKNLDASGADLSPDLESWKNNGSDSNSERGEIVFKRPNGNEGTVTEHTRVFYDNTSDIVKETPHNETDLMLNLS